MRTAASAYYRLPKEKGRPLADRPAPRTNGNDRLQFNISFKVFDAVNLGTREAFNIISPLREGLLSYLSGNGNERLDTIREKASQVGIKESYVGKIKSDLIRQVFTSPLEPWQKMQLEPCLTTIMRVSDRAKEAADELEIIAMKSKV